MTDPKTNEQSAGVTEKQKLTVAASLCFLNATGLRPELFGTQYRGKHGTKQRSGPPMQKDHKDRGFS